MPKAAHQEIYRKLSEQIDALDKLCRETSSPIRDARHYDQLESQAQAIAKNLIAAFRGRSAQ